MKTQPPTISNQDFLEMARLLKARIQYAQMKLNTGLSTEDFQQIEHAFLCSPRQPRRPLASEYPPTPPSSSSSKRLKKLPLSAMNTPNQKSWKKRKSNEDEEDAARTILMLKQHQPHTPPPSEKRHTTDYYDHHDTCSDTDQLDMFDYVNSIPHYKEKSQAVGKSLPRMIVPPLQYQPLFNNNRSLPPPPMYGRPLSEDPFLSKPIIIRNNNTLVRHTTPPSPPSPYYKTIDSPQQ